LCVSLFTPPENNEVMKYKIEFKNKNIKLNSKIILYVYNILYKSKMPKEIVLVRRIE
jgi:hypothetical protein